MEPERSGFKFSRFYFSARLNLVAVAVKKVPVGVACVKVKVGVIPVESVVVVASSRNPRNV